MGNPYYSPPLISRHLNQSEHNKELLDIIIQNYKKFKDWIITIVFYYALHRVQAKLIEDFHLNPKQHWDPNNPNNSRNNLVSKHFPQIAGHWRALYQMSQDLRYKPMAHIFKDEREILNIVEETLKAFEQIP